MAIAALLDEALGAEWPPRAVARQSLDAAERPQARRRLHRRSRTTAARERRPSPWRRPRREARRPRWSRTGRAARRPGPAQHVIVTPVHDDSWCHTVAYTSSIAVGAVLARELGLEGVDGDRGPRTS